MKTIKCGAAVPGCGIIHRNEIIPTVNQLQSAIGWNSSLVDNIIGSAGKVEYSGDIDVVIDSSKYSVAALKTSLIEVYGIEKVARHGNMLHACIPIGMYDANVGDSLLRTRYVQIDFIFGDPTWEKIYHSSPGDQSEYKGAHRNLLISAICAATAKNKSAELDSCNRPISQIRWKWGASGLIQVHRVSLMSNALIWKKTQVDIPIRPPVKDLGAISGILFGKSGTPADLYSFETLVSAIRQHYSLDECEQIWQCAATNFYNWPDGHDYEYIPEIAKYWPVSDK